MDDKLKILNQTGMFAEMRPEIRNQLVGVLSEIEVERGKLIIKKGTTGKSMFIIAQGQVKVHDGTHILTRLNAGDVFGEYALIDAEKRSASVTASEYTILYRLDQEDFYALMGQNINFLKGVLKVLTKRLRERNELEEKLAKSYIKIQKQKQEIEAQHENIKGHKQELEMHNYDLVSLNEEKNQLLSVVIHGLKSPLTSSLCVADMMHNTKNELDSHQEEYVELICKSLRRMNSMVNQMLDINTIESKKIKLRMEKIYISSVVKEVLQNFNLYIEQKKIDIDLQLQNLQGRLNKVYLFQIIDNLLSNAVKFTPENGKIKIKLFEKDKSTFLEIIDNGPGVPKSEVENIFYQYKRQSSKIFDTDEQSGLGLAIVKKYVTAMNGKVYCESETGEGARFIIEFKSLIENANYS
jgi:signal transduction histidine kinase